MIESSVIPSFWLHTELGKVLDYGKVEKAKPNEIPLDAWILELEDIEKDTSKLLQRIICEQRQPKSTKNRFRKGDVLYSRLRPYLNKVLIADQDGYCTTEIIPLKPNDAILGPFLFYWLKHPEFLKYVDAVSYGINMPRLGTKDGLKAPLILAPYEEQKLIVNVLNSLFTRIEACRERLERVQLIIEHFRQSVLAATMSGTLTEEWRDENQIDDLWQETDIQAIAEVNTGSTPSRANSSFYSEQGTPWVTSSATNDPIITSAQEFVTDEAIQAYRLKLFPVGTLVIALYGAGKTRGQISELAIEATINQACAAINVDETKADKNFVKLAIQANYFQIRQMAEGATQPNLNLTKIKGFRIPLPSFSEQREIVNRVESVFRIANRLEQRCQAAVALLTQLTPSLLSSAFRGELVKQNLTDEPASNLLEHIRLERTKQADTPKKSRPSRPKRVKMTEESVKEAINQFSDDAFSFEELRNSIPGDYEKLKEIVFSLLSKTEAPIKQVFEPNRKVICLIRSDQ